MRKVLVITFGVLLLVTPFAEDAFAQRGGGGGLPAAEIQFTCRESEKSLKAIFGESTAVTSKIGADRVAQPARDELHGSSGHSDRYPVVMGHLALPLMMAIAAGPYATRTYQSQ